MEHTLSKACWIHPSASQTPQLRWEGRGENAMKTQGSTNYIGKIRACPFPSTDPTPGRYPLGLAHVSLRISAPSASTIWGMVAVRPHSHAKLWLVLSSTSHIYKSFPVQATHLHHLEYVGSQRLRGTWLLTCRQCTSISRHLSFLNFRVYLGKSHCSHTVWQGNKPQYISVCSSVHQVLWHSLISLLRRHNENH